MSAFARRLSRDPVVWRAAVASVVLALLQVGVLTSDQAAAVDNGVKVSFPVVTLLLPIIAGLLARRRTAPVAAGTPPVQLLARNSKGVYEPASPAKYLPTIPAGHEVTGGYTGAPGPVPPPAAV